jgi:3-oxoadipate enol-lactonase
LARDDLDGAVEANLAWWVDGPHRDVDDVDPAVRELVGQMQRQAFELTAGWETVAEKELDPPALERLAEIRVPTLVLVGALDLDAIVDTARRVGDGIPDAHHVDWPDTAHLPSMERPDDFFALLRKWLAA